MVKNKEKTGVFKPKMEKTKKFSLKISSFLLDIVRGFAIGVAFIIPGFSGGSIAAILGIYEKLIGAIADIFKDFKKSVKTLFPIGVGMVIGVLSLLFPLSWALENFPIPTVSLFVGLAIGGIPSITDRVKGGKTTLKNFLASIIPALIVIAISFMPIGADKNLTSLSFGGYLLLFLIGILGSSALVIPGISGSMLLLILGYYNPIVNLITDHILLGKDIAVSLLVLGVTALGIAIGFIGISVIMKFLLKNYPRATYFAIIGFIVGSIPTIFVSTVKEAGMSFTTLPASPLHWITSVLLLAVGFFLSYALVVYSRRLTAKTE